MRGKQKWLYFLMYIAVLMYLQALLAQPIYADVEEVDTGSQNISKVEVADSNNGESVGGGGENVPWWKKLWDDTVDFGKDLWDSAKDQWNEFEDWAEDAWDGAEDWFSDLGDAIGDWIGDALDATGEFLSNIWEWVKDNEWFQSLVAGIIAAAAIIGGAILIIGTAPGWLVIGAVSLLTIGGSFLYQWIAGDSYNFFGALLSGVVGGLIGYFGITTGAFAAGWTWLSRTAGPAAWNWLRNTAAPWVIGKGRAAWTWMRGTAFPWLRGKVVAGWRWFRGLPVWREFRSTFAGGIWGKFFKGFAFSGSISALVSTIEQFVTNGKLDLIKLATDTILGGIVGGAIAPVLVPGVAISGSLITFVGVAGGIENWLGGVITKGEVFSWQNFVSGALTSLVSFGALTKVFSRIPNPFFEEVTTKGTENLIKSGIDNLLKGFGNGEANPIEDKPNEQPKQAPPENPSKQTPAENSSKDTTNNQGNNPENHQESRPVEEPNISQEKVERDPVIQPEGINPQPLQN